MAARVSLRCGGSSRVELEGLPDGVDDPAQDDLAGPPTAVSFEELLQGDGFVAVFLVGKRVSQDLVDRVQQVPTESRHAFAPPLAQLDEVVHEHVCGSKRALVWAVGRGCRSVGFQV